MPAPEPCRRSGRSPDATGECPDASGRCKPPLKGRSQLTQAVQPRSHRVVRDAGGRRGCDRHAWCTLDHFPVGWSTPRGCSGQLWIIVTGVGPGRWMGRLPGFPEHMIAMVSANKQDRRDTPDFANRRRAGRGDSAVLVAVESRSAARIRGPTRRTRQSIIRVGRRKRVSGGVEGAGAAPSPERNVQRCVRWLKHHKGASQPPDERAGRLAALLISGRQRLHTVQGEARFRPCQPPEPGRFPKTSIAVPEPYRAPAVAPPTPWATAAGERRLSGVTLPPDVPGGVGQIGERRKGALRRDRVDILRVLLSSGLHHREALTIACGPHSGFCRKALSAAMRSTWGSCRRPVFLRYAT